MFGATRSAALFAAVWTHRTGCQALLGHYQRLYALDSVRLPSQPNGSPRPVTMEDRPVLFRWLAAFDAEAGTRPVDLEARVDQLIGECRALVWTGPDGIPVSVVAWSPLVAGMSASARRVVMPLGDGRGAPRGRRGLTEELPTEGPFTPETGTRQELR